MEQASENRLSPTGIWANMPEVNITIQSGDEEISYINEF
jgi:hypothetical protein